MTLNVSLLFLHLHPVKLGINAISTPSHLQSSASLTHRRSDLPIPLASDVYQSCYTPSSGRATIAIVDLHTSLRSLAFPRLRLKFVPVPAMDVKVHA